MKSKYGANRVSFSIRQVLPQTGNTLPRSIAWCLSSTKTSFVMGKSAFIDHGLAIVLAQRLEAFELEKPVGGGEELRRSDLVCELFVAKTDGSVGDKARIPKAGCFGE